MEINFSQSSPHRPIHIYADETYYFITARTVESQKLLDTNEKLKLLFNQIGRALKECSLTIQSWVILPNHYQLQLKTSKGGNLQNFFNLVHGRSSYLLNRIDGQKGRRVWYQYWDWCLRSERDFWMHVNYNHYNPKKHGYIDDPFQWPFSSIHQYVKLFSFEGVNEMFTKYPVSEFDPEWDND